MKHLQRFCCLALAGLVLGCGFIKVKPLPSLLAEDDGVQAAKIDPRVVYRFFDEMYTPGGFDYVYPDESRVYIPEESGKNGEVSLQFDLVAADFSGGSVCLYNLLYDLTPYYASGALEFWIKGKNGGEIAWTALIDEENTDGKKTAVRLLVNNYGKITKEWTHISVPLQDFGTRGVYWDAKKSVEVPAPFDWDKVAEFRIEIKKGDNAEFRVWVDDIFILRDVVDAPADGGEDQKYWDEREDVIPGPPLAQGPEVKVLHTLFGNDLPAGAFIYAYGGKTTSKVQPTDDKNNAGVFAMYQDNSDYSGVSIALGQGKNVDLTKLRKTRAGLAFWAKAGEGVSKVYVGITDDESDGAKVQTKVALADFGKLGAEWQYFMVPLKRFGEDGLFWDENKKAEVLGKVKWDKINEFRFSTNRFENQLPDGVPVDIYVDELVIIEEIPGYVDPDEYWTEFKSNKPEVLLHDFETATDRRWEISKGEKSEISFAFVSPPGGDKAHGKKSLRVEYNLGDYCDCMYQYDSLGSPVKQRDWSKHWGLRFSFYSEKPYQAVTIQINDSGDEIYVTNVGGQKGWSEVLVPFKKFTKFPYYQPPGAVENGVFDLASVRGIDFKPSGEGSIGDFTIDNVKLTNLRELEKPEVAEQVAVTVTGDFGKTVTGKINDGIFGINVALWDGDMLKPKTAEYVKPVKHGVLRYPGGLRADEDHWKEVVDHKDWMVDTDEYLEFCKKTGNEAMITVNYGRGTPEEAAAWVKYVNVDNDYNVRYWEIGNELYGDWHPQHCTADEYGKRAAEYIRQMKAVDPDILVTVVWVLKGSWNKTVLEHTKDLADGIIVHHYPQHGGEENDFALLAAPQSLDDILPSVKNEIKESGTPGKKYEIWLTEWNSVDFDPTPQIFTIVNGLFVADYLGMLAKHNIEQASYWDVHNAITPQGGDYGYLSRTGAPDGDNVPRVSYWAFRLASEALRGRMVEAKSSDENVTAYLCEQEDGAKSMMLINKLPHTRAAFTLDIPGFSGKAVVHSLDSESGIKGFAESGMTLSDGGSIVVKPHSITTIRIE